MKTLQLLVTRKDKASYRGPYHVGTIIELTNLHGDLYYAANPYHAYTLKSWLRLGVIIPDAPQPEELNANQTSEPYNGGAE